MSDSDEDYKLGSAIAFPSVDSMVADALQVVQTEILKYKSKVHQGRSLDIKEAKILQGYIKSLVELSREDRERTRESDLSDVSDEELIKLLGRKVPKQLKAAE